MRCTTRNDRAGGRRPVLDRAVTTRWLFWLLAIGGSYQAVGATEPPGKKYLIIHADDAGMSHSVNAATIEAIQRGVVSSASIMVPCPWFSEFAEYCRAHPQGDYGIHLTLNAEWKHYRWGPVAPRAQVPSLIDPEGHLWANVQQVAQHVKAKEVAIELRAQIDRAVRFGIPLSHLDTHMGALASRPDLLEIYVQLGLEYDLPILFVRDTRDPAVQNYPAFAERGPALLKQLDARRLPVVDRLARFSGGDTHQVRRANYLKTLRGLQPGVTELIIHCGYDNQELRAITHSAARRDSDRRTFSDPDVASLIRELGIEVISWRQFRKLAVPQ